ncbi:hypothetical protein RU86_GL001318 [Lactococcus piscium]|uniref:DNA-binding protein n=1 Tax=Pseudolactococcus piscium TaxID=1364 RepID=A0A2A5RUW2_9LACT|nr:hypothetical protein [Lactococcus piscium]PCS05049.1 hypothetical protein RU86_GL001318 [Lactococcus piscium]
MEINQIFGDEFLKSLREQSKLAYLQGVEDGKKLNKKRGFGNIVRAQEETGFGRDAITKLRKEKKISFVKNGSKYLYDLDELYHYMQRNKTWSK